MMRFKILFALAIFIAQPLVMFSQENEEEEIEEACLKVPTNKKIAKLLKSSHDKGIPYQKRYQALKDALEIDEECGVCLWELAKKNFIKAKSEGGEYFEHSIKYYEQLIGVCPEYHADMYYNLGIIYYNKTNDEMARKYFNQYLKFPTDDEDKLGRRYSEQVDDVKAVLPEIDFFLDFYSKPVKFDPKLVQNVSSQKDEFLPMISPDNEILMYTRRYEYKGKGDMLTQTLEDLTISNRGSYKDPWDKGRMMPQPFNHGEFDKLGGVSFSIDNHEMYVCACKTDPNSGQSLCDIYVTNYEEHYDEKKKRNVYEWTDMENLGPNVNSTDPGTWEAQPSISADGNTLYFASARPDCYKNAQGQITMDLFYSERQEDGTWGIAKNMGPTINSGDHEKAPFMHSDSRTLYYVAHTNKKRLGAGGYDVFYSQQDPKTKKWSKPKNLGFPINSEGDEEGLIVSIDGEHAFISSNKSGGVGLRDIYSFILPHNVRPDAVVLYKGEINDDKGIPVTDVEVELTFKDDDGKTTTVKAPSKINDKGQIVAIVNMGKHDAPKDVLLSVKKDGHSFDSKVFKAKDFIAKKIPLVVKDPEKLEVSELVVGKSYTIDDILYTTSSADVEPDSEIILDGFAQYLIDNPKIKVEIQGHTDDVGNDARNLALSQDRAFTVLEYLSLKGVKSSRLKFKGYGEGKPKYPNDSDMNRARNRRTDFKIISL
ncbi:MAG: outer membrane protein OmpA-like peptidoglycan-associated protein [Parvicellaceae bacterium]|jgi:outer membrane protein OmpA-like peptidoglycan-associated protein/tetratricopeptide (TPR) repeat protein